MNGWKSLMSAFLLWPILTQSWTLMIFVCGYYCYEKKYVNLTFGIDDNLENSTNANDTWIILDVYPMMKGRKIACKRL